MSETKFITTVKEKDSDSPPREVDVEIMSEYGTIWIQPHRYGEACADVGDGYPIGIEIWEGRLRLVVFDDINNEEPKIIDLEGARETARKVE